MKKLLIMFAALAFMASCSEDEIDTFSNTPLASVVGLERGGFYNDYIETDNIAFDFISEATKDIEFYDVKMKVFVSDIKRDYARTIKLKYSGDFNATAQPDFPATVEIPAGKITLEVNFKVHRPKGEDAKLENLVTVAIDNGANYLTGPQSSFTLDYGAVPSAWPSSWGWGADYFLGPASKVKFKIIYDLFGVFYYPVTMSWGSFDTNTQNNFVKPLKKYIEDYNNESIVMERKYGSIPLKDENGNVI